MKSSETCRTVHGRAGGRLRHEPKHFVWGALRPAARRPRRARMQMRLSHVL